MKNNQYIIFLSRRQLELILISKRILLLFTFLGLGFFSHGQCTDPDDTPPVMVCPPDLEYDNDSGECYAYVSYIPDIPKFIVPPPSTNDNCVNGLTLTLDGVPTGNLFPVGETVLTWTLEDAAGNSVQCLQTITIKDTEGPILLAVDPNETEADVGLCTAYVSIPLATATDNCGSSTVITNNYNANGADASDVYPVGTTTVTFTASDGTFTSTFDIDVTVVNTQSPVISLVGSNDITIEACSIFNDPGATAFDNCLGDISADVVVDSSELDLTSPGSYTVRYNVINGAGISGTEVNRTINVIDTTTPVLSFGADGSTQFVGDCSTYVDPGVVMDDGCVTNVNTVQVTGDTVDTTTLGTYFITYSFTDDAGNVASSITRTVEVINTTGPEVTLLGESTITLLACTSYSEPGYTAEDPCTFEDFTANTVIDSSELDLSVPGVYTIYYTSFDDEPVPNEGPTAERIIIVEPNTYIADAGPDVATANCSVTSVNLAANAPPGLLEGTWSVSSGQTSGFSFSNINDPNAVFTGDVGETYTLDWIVSYGGGCPDPSDQLTITIDTCDALDFDGTDDNVTFRDNFNFTGDFSIELWVKPEAQSLNTQTLLSKRETNNQVDGYDLRLVNNVVSFNWNNGQSISTTPYTLNTNTWHHVAVTFDGSTYTLYVDGIALDSLSDSNQPITNTVDFILGAMEETINTPTDQDLHFNGGLDELRIWNIALTEKQIRQMMNQELYDDAGTLKGKEIQVGIDGLSWNDLNSYYQMNQVSDISSGSLVSSNGISIEGILRFMSSYQDETAPIPYESENDGDWNSESSWLHGNARSIPNGFGIDGITIIDWNIVKISHAIEATDRNLNLSSLIIDNGSLRVSNSDASDGQYIYIEDYLNLKTTNSKLTLVGESQLIQGENGMVDYTGEGQLIRDQQGTPNMFNYNYWSSPVSSDGNLFQIGTVLHDGNTPVQWTNGFNGNASTSPITLSRRWLYLFENHPEDDYYSWNPVDETSSISVGLGYIAKGTGTSQPEQNYSFIGKPNNGAYNLPITPGNRALVGNPYPSAIDANQFINDNSTSIQGALYFWEQFETNNTHIFADYQGGYATYSLSGAVEAVAHPDISDQGTASKLPERYVPVGQGFFVASSSTGGSVNFNNGQRVFVKESITGDGSGSVFMRNATIVDNPEPDIIQRIRLDFHTPEGARRPLLLAFTPNDIASDNFDFGYDALNIEVLPSDASWIIDDTNYVIQGVGSFNEDKTYPLFVKTQMDGSVKFAIRSLENFDHAVSVYLLDSESGSTQQLTAEGLSLDLLAGEYSNRFYIVFRPDAVLSAPEKDWPQLDLRYLSERHEIQIILPNITVVDQAYLYNMLGQQVQEWSSETLIPQNGKLNIPIQRIDEGLYIFIIDTDQGPKQLKFLYNY
ncbi:immunoglobulin-like domain-containing protein [Winogradskyella aurantiaca]|uniref:immunoglobulin-like domain-containing protein n=1 Tax=Winogradskyella aurantiaca TaxID=2219558 RepID=UPI0013005818|nr:immunoglobulin-like domain-containing protein [Winogradskyella aurantiaca]